MIRCRIYPGAVDPDSAGRRFGKTHTSHAHACAASDFICSDVAEFPQNAYCACVLFKTLRCCCRDPGFGRFVPNLGSAESMTTTPAIRENDEASSLNDILINNYIFARQGALLVVSVMLEE